MSPADARALQKKVKAGTVAASDLIRLEHHTQQLLTQLQTLGKTRRVPIRLAVPLDNILNGMQNIYRVAQDLPEQRQRQAIVTTFPLAVQVPRALNLAVIPEDYHKDFSHYAAQIVEAVKKFQEQGRKPLAKGEADQIATMPEGPIKRVFQQVTGLHVEKAPAALAATVPAGSVAAPAAAPALSATVPVTDTEQQQVAFKKAVEALQERLRSLTRGAPDRFQVGKDLQDVSEQDLPQTLAGFKRMIANSRQEVDAIESDHNRLVGPSRALNMPTSVLQGVRDRIAAIKKEIDAIEQIVKKKEETRDPAEAARLRNLGVVDLEHGGS